MRCAVHPEGRAVQMPTKAIKATSTRKPLKAMSKYRWQLADVRARGVGLGKAHAIPRLQTKGAEEHENAASGQNDGLHHHLAKGGFGADACGKTVKTGSDPGGIGTLSCRPADALPRTCAPSSA